MNTLENKYFQQLTCEIEFLLYHKSGDFNEIVRELGSVDIPVAKNIYDDYTREAENRSVINTYRSKFKTKRLNARSQTAQFIYDLPASNSMFSQWWFSLDSIEKIAFQIRRLAGKGSIAFLGAPSVAFFT